MNEETAQESTQVINWDINKNYIASVAEEYKDVDAYKDFDAAKAAKKRLVKMRGALNDAHKETKAEALAFGRKVDAAKNEYLELIRAIEDPISAALDDIKNAEAKKEEERKAGIMGQIERIQAFSLDRHSLTLDELEERLTNLRAFEIEVPFFEEFAEDAEMAKQEADLKLRLAIDREKQELQEKEEKAELQRKLDEADAKLAKVKEEEDERNRVAKEQADAAAAEQRKIDDARQKELDDQQAEIDRQNAEREAQLQADADAEAMANAEREAQALRDLQAPDIEKLKKYAEAIDHLIGLKPVMGSTAGNACLLHTLSALIDIHDTFKFHIEEMT